ncbi:MAG: bifunctional 4-hydroxy-2-oxoglutarate aldolase/2-dehydro-3-deoxy-phosphogluconate aldolase [Pseudomonadales bacterium]|jgi:2-dehydro-3-deoxyphosphogluconate aldolase/(4S)-4-hydroxy-2-oxoglutarate aldolase
MDSKSLLLAAKVLPVLVIERVEDAVPLANALVEGGIKVLEVTLRSDAALGAIEAIRANVPDAVVGVGSVRTEAEWHAAVAAGAQFGVSPGCTTALADVVSKGPVPFVPGVATPSEAMKMAEYGFEVVKLFPATVVGGVGLLKAMSGPLADIKFCPTGGVGPANAKDFLALPNVVCVGGSWMVDNANITAGNWSAITEAAKQAIAACTL